MDRNYSRRIFTAKTFFKELGFLIWNSLRLIKVFTNKRIKRLIGKILIVIDAVNECEYCTWMDAKLAIKNGVSEEEVKNMLKLEFETNISDYELPALMFAQHYAENLGMVDANMQEELTEYYGERLAKDILLAIRAVTFGNLYFNTWGAFPSRLKGNPAVNSNLLFEMIYFICNFIIIVPFILLKKLDRNAIALEVEK